MSECTTLLVFSNLLSFALGMAIVFYIFIKSDMEQIRGIRRFFRNKAEEQDGNGKPEQGQPEQIPEQK